MRKLLLSIVLFTISLTLLCQSNDLKYSRAKAKIDSLATVYNVEKIIVVSYKSRTIRSRSYKFHEDYLMINKLNYYNLDDLTSIQIISGVNRYKLRLVFK